MGKQKKYVAIIMNRVYSKDGDFIYVANHPEIGYLDEKTHIFTDRNGNEFLSMLDGSLMMSEISEAHYGAIPLDRVIEKTGTAPLREAIADYAYGSTRYIYYASSLPDNIPFVIPIPLDDLRASLNNFYNKSLSEDRNSEVTRKDETKNDNQNISSKRDNEKYKPAHAMEDGEDVVEEDLDINDIMMNILEGKYSMGELRELSAALSEKRDDLDSLLESIDIQIEASENGVSKNKIRNYDSNPRSIKLPANYIDFKKLYDRVTQTLIAQDEPLRRVIAELIRKIRHPEARDKAILLTGSTGVGKTKMMSLISENINVPYMKVDSTKLTIPGFVGTDIEEVLWNLYIDCGKDKKKAENAIIFFDEIDKKGSDEKSDVSGQGVLNILLPFVEGGVYTACEDTKKAGESVQIDTSNMIVVFGGAFNDVYEELSRNGNSIGFGKEISTDSTDVTVKIEDFVKKAKMTKELMGRISTIVKLNDLDVDSIKRILLESDESAIKRQKKYFDELGVKLTPGYDYINRISEEAAERKTGARGISGVVDDTTWEAYADAYINLGKYSEIILGKETVEDPKQYKKVYRKNNS